MGGGTSFLSGVLPCIGSAPMCFVKPRSKRYFTSKDGYNTLDLLHFGIDHIASSGVLFGRGPRCYDSAGYLAHIGFELLFKALALYSQGQFLKSHNFKALLSRKHLGKCHLTVPESHADIIRKLNKFADLRYPQSRDPISIGEEDWCYVARPKSA